MTRSTFGKVAQMLYADEHPLDFVQVVEALHRTLSRSQDNAVSFGWEGEALAVFELSAVRIVLGLKDRPGSGHSACLTISVQPAANGSDPVTGAAYTETCSSLVDHLHRRHPAMTILWHHADEPLTHHLHDRLIAALPPLKQPPTELAPDAKLAVSLPRPASDTIARLSVKRRAKGAGQTGRMSLARSVSTSVPARALNARARGRSHFAASATGDLPLPATVTHFRPQPDRFDSDFARVRAALNHRDAEPEASRLSAPLRLTVHALNASLILVWAPLGVVAMTYTLFTGEDLRLSGRLVALAGVFSATQGTPVGQFMAAMAGS